MRETQVIIRHGDSESFYTALKQILAELQPRDLMQLPIDGCMDFVPNDANATMIQVYRAE